MSLRNDINEALWDNLSTEDTNYGLPKIVGHDKATDIVISLIKSNNYMTGQEWYDRFIQELGKWSSEHDGLVDPVGIVKKAAGLDG